MVVISDFRDQRDWERPLGSLQMRHSVLGFEIVDPRELELPAVGLLALIDPGDRPADRDRHVAQPRPAALRRARDRSGATLVARELRRLRVEHVELSTDDDWLLALGRRLR